VCHGIQSHLAMVIAARHVFFLQGKRVFCSRSRYNQKRMMLLDPPRILSRSLNHLRSIKTNTLRVCPSKREIRIGYAHHFCR